MYSNFPIGLHEINGNMRSLLLNGETVDLREHRHLHGNHGWSIDLAKVVHRHRIIQHPSHRHRLDAALFHPADQRDRGVAEESSGWWVGRKQRWQRGNGGRKEEDIYLT